jgi:hypothetical protein
MGFPGKVVYREILGPPGRWPAWRTGKSVLPHAGAPPCAAFRSLPRLRNPSLAHLAHASTEYTRLCTHTHRTRGSGQKSQREHTKRTYTMWKLCAKCARRRLCSLPRLFAVAHWAFPGCASGAPDGAPALNRGGWREGWRGGDRRPDQERRKPASRGIAKEGRSSESDRPPRPARSAKTRPRRRRHTVSVRWRPSLTR